MSGKILRERLPMLRVAFLILVVTMLLGCAGPGLHYGRRCISSDIESRTRYTLGPAARPCDVSIPPGVEWNDGVSEDEAVAIALWNNAAYQELLAELGVARAEIIEAGQLTNPQFATMLPVGVKQLEFVLHVPLEALWLRPRRLAQAELKSQQTAKRLVRDGLDLIRDVRVAHADLLLARDRLRIAREGAALRRRIAGLAEAGVRAGSASGLDAYASRIDHLVQAQQAAQLEHGVELARQELRRLMGTGFLEIAINPVPPVDPDLHWDPDRLVSEALSARPDLWAAELAYAAARHRAGLARRDYFQISAMLPDANARGKKGFEAGPGLTFTVPIFHQNQGAIARADAEVERAERHCVAVRDAIAMEVQQAYTRYVRAREALRAWDEQIVPTVEDAVAKAEKAYRAGGTSLLLMLETSRRLLDSQVERARAAAELRQAVAELERSVGGRVLDRENATIAAVEESP